MLSELRTTRPVRVADLTGTGAARLNADVWLTKCDPSGYLATRRWAAAVVAANPDIDGLQYRPRHDENNLAWMLAAGPTVTAHPAVSAVGGVVPLDSADGHYLLGHCSRLTTPPSHPDPAGGGPRHRVFRALIDPDATRSAVLVEDAPDSASTHRDLP